MPLLLLLYLALGVSAQPSGVHLTVLPSRPPMVTTRDSWECATKDIRGYFEPPQPTGSLSAALLDYGDIIQTCTLSGIEAFKCPFPEKSLWCGFSTYVPATLSEEYIAYGSTAASWWAARSSAAVSIARECPNSWWEARDRVSFGATRLNLTIIEAVCFVEANPTASSGNTAIPPTATLSSTPSPTPSANSDKENSGRKRDGGAAMWVAAATCLTAGAIDSVL